MRINPMKIDIHFHAMGSGISIDNIDNDVYFVPDDNNHWFTRILYSFVEGRLESSGVDLDEDGKISTHEYFEMTYNLLTSSEEIDGIVLLALDAVYSPEDGNLDEVRTDLWVSNKFLNRKVEELNARLQSESDPRLKDKRFYLGSSVSPNRLDWETELDYILMQTDAVLMKWIPSTQHIKVDDNRHTDFYQALAENGLPLLCHTGPEYAFPEGIRKNELDDFRYLEKPLECGVTVIAAHCSAPVFPIIDRDEISQFLNFMRQINSNDDTRLWADTSALSLATRIPSIQEIVEKFPPQWLIHGSDYPVPIDGWPHLPLVTHDMTVTEYFDIIRTLNPLDMDVRLKRAHGFSNTILENAEKVLRIN